MSRTSITFGSSASWKPVPVQEHPLVEWEREYVAGFTEAAKDIAAGKVRITFGSFAISGFATGYRAGIREAGEKR